MKLSVVIANHNYRSFVGAAIESALAVDWPDKEVIIVDDGSSDELEKRDKQLPRESGGVFEAKIGSIGRSHFRLRTELRGYDYLPRR